MHGMMENMIGNRAISFGGFVSPHASVHGGVEDFIFFVGLAQEHLVLDVGRPDLFRALVFHVERVVGSQQHVRVQQPHSIHVYEESKLHFVYWILEGLSLLVVVHRLGNALSLALSFRQDRVGRGLDHWLHHDNQLTKTILREEAHFECYLPQICKLAADFIQNHRQHLGSTDKSYIQIVVIPKHPQGHFLHLDILVSVDLLGVVIGDKSPVHPADLHLHHILEEPSSNKVVIFSFEAFEQATFAVDFVVHVLLVFGHSIADGSARTRFYLEHVRLPFLVVRHAVDLRAQQQIVVDLSISVVIVWLHLVLASHQQVSLIFCVGEEELHDVPQIHQHLIARREDTLIRYNRVVVAIWDEVKGDGFAVGDHPVDGSARYPREDVIHLRQAEVAKEVVEGNQRVGDAGRGREISAVGLFGFANQLLIIGGLNVAADLLEDGGLQLVSLGQVADSLIAENKFAIQVLVQPVLELGNFGEVDIVGEAFELEAREGDLDGVNIADGRADFLFSGSRADISELKIPCKLVLH